MYLIITLLLWLAHVYIGVVVMQQMLLVVGVVVIGIGGLVAAVIELACVALVVVILSAFALRATWRSAADGGLRSTGRPAERPRRDV